MKVVKNDLLQEKWDADGFYISKKRGFIGAVIIYDGKAVGFFEGLAFCMVDEDGNFYDRETLKKVIKESSKPSTEVEPRDYEEYVELGTVEKVDIDNLECVGLKGYADDIHRRLKDLADVYWWEVMEEARLN